MFFVNVPVALFSLVAAAKLVPETRDRSAGRPDLLGAGLLIGALVAVVYPLLEGRRLGWPAWGFVLLAGGVAALVALGLIEERRQRSEQGRQRVAPLLRARLFKIPAFSAGLGLQLAFSAGLQGFSIIFALWAQTGQHYSPLRAASRWSPSALAASCGSGAVPLAQR